MTCVPPRPFALSLSKGLHSQCPGFDKLSPNGGRVGTVWRGLRPPHPFTLSLSKGPHTPCPGLNRFSLNG
ncbi:hypothetical protein C8C98_3944 [Acidovorax sp. 106]|nr:hypothetical protein C8C98_3944 [Acidovorax sp. 106]